MYIHMYVWCMCVNNQIMLLIIHFLQGLPSAYLQPSSVYSSASQTSNSHSLSHTPSLTPNSSPLHSPSPPLPSGVLGRGGGEKQRGDKEQHRTSHNPFDSEGTCESLLYFMNEGFCYNFHVILTGSHRTLHTCISPQMQPV